MGFFPWEIWGCFPRGKPTPTEWRYPTYGACWVFRCLYNPLNSDMDHGIFDVRTDVNACNCTQGYTDIVTESALKVDSGRKIPCRTGESNLRQRRAGPMLYQLSYIPTLLSKSPDSLDSRSAYTDSPEAILLRRR